MVLTNKMLKKGTPVMINQKGIDKWGRASDQLPEGAVGIITGELGLGMTLVSWKNEDGKERKNGYYLDELMPATKFLLGKI